MIAQDTIYCVKTGQPIGTLFQASEYHPSAIHHDWQSTDGQNLDRLQEHAPRAYVAFCLGLVDRFWRSRQHRGDAKGTFTTKQDALEHHWSLVRAYEILGNVPESQLEELANACWRFVAYSPLSYRILDKALMPGRRAADLLAETAQAGKLATIMDKAYVETIASALGYSTSGASVKTAKFELKAKGLKDAIKGPSNIKEQNKAREYNKNAKQNKLMADLIRIYNAELGIADTKKSQASALMARLSRQSDKLDSATVIHKPYQEADDKEQDLLAALDNIMQGGFSSGPEIEEEEDMVEMRHIPRAIVESLVEQPKPIPAPAPTPAPRMSLLERIARNSKKD